MADLAGELERLGKLRGAGILNEDEFRTAKGRCPAESFRPSTPQALRWEYKEITVPLNTSAKVSSLAVNNQRGAFMAGARGSESLASQIILEALQREGREGWRPDELADPLRLYQSRRVRARQTGGLVTSWNLKFQSATIRLRRLA